MAETDERTIKNGCWTIYPVNRIDETKLEFVNFIGVWRQGILW